ncbi:MAG: proline dehydrogenase [Candelina mexicana]|nr:MAG: proline dehydrogenase [Candelina mexicana]
MSPFLNPDRNPALSYFLKQTFYAHFCAGGSPVEVRRTLQGLKDIGYAGVCLCYAREVVVGQKELKGVESVIEEGSSSVAASKQEIEDWKIGTLKTIQMTASEDFVAVKLTGAGSQALHSLLHNLPPSPSLFAAITEICDAAASKGVRLLFDAEQHAVQAGIDAWTLTFQRRYNRNRVVVYGTYQAYLKACPKVLAEHLALAQKEGFTLGVKLVRGAYLATDPRNLIWDNKGDTDATYDGLAECLFSRSYSSLMPAATDYNGSATFPRVSVVLASHNHASVRKAQAIRTKQLQSGEMTVDTVYAQLMGMADEVSCELLQAGREAAKSNSRLGSTGNVRVVDVPKAYKYLVWGSTGECMKYLLRRAEENRDAMERTREGRNALVRELWRRLKQRLRLGAG